MSPFEKYDVVYQFNVLVYKLYGVEFMDPNLRLTLRSWIPAYLQANYYGLLAYSIFYYRNDPINLLKATPAAGVMVPVSV